MKGRIVTYSDKYTGLAAWDDKPAVVRAQFRPRTLLFWKLSPIEGYAVMQPVYVYDHWGGDKWWVITKFFVDRDAAIEFARDLEGVAT